MVRDDRRRRREAAGQVLPVGGQIIHGEGHGREQQHRHARQHDDRHRLALHRLFLKAHVFVL